MANFISIPRKNELRNKNLLLIAKLYWFTWIIFHFTIVYFFLMILDSLLLVWLFLWLWNLIALIIDIPIWVLQKYYKPKNILIFWNILMIISILIFIKFIFFSSLPDLIPSFLKSDFNSDSLNNIGLFFDNWINYFLILITSLLYWIIKECFDVTLYSYVLNKSNPSEYAENLSKYNISFWIWAIIWLVISWVILWLSIKIAIFTVFIIVLLLLYTIIKLFDKTNNTIEFSQIHDVNITNIKWWINKGKSYIVWNIKKTDIQHIITNTKYIFLIPIEIKNKISSDEILKKTYETFINVYKIIAEKPRNLIVLWSLSIIMCFWFWDTFVSVFQIEFLNKVITDNSANILISNSSWFITWYVLLWLLIIPIFLSQQYFIRKSKIHSVFSVISFWVLLSGISIFFFWLSQNIVFIIILWLLNSFWYAAAMPLAMATFSENYNIEYAKKYNLKEINSNSSAAPLKIIMNLANILWLVLWWILIQYIWFDKFFIFFWTILLVFLLISYLNKEIITKED